MSNVVSPSRFEPLWGIEEASSYLGVAPKTLYMWRARKYGPPSYRLGNKIRYRPEEVRAWVDAQGLRSWLEENGALSV